MMSLTWILTKQRKMASTNRVIDMDDTSIYIRGENFGNINAQRFFHVCSVIKARFETPNPIYVRHTVYFQQCLFNFTLTANDVFVLEQFKDRNLTLVFDQCVFVNLDCITLFTQSVKFKALGFMYCEYPDWSDAFTTEWKFFTSHFTIEGEPHKYMGKLIRSVQYENEIQVELCLYQRTNYTPKQIKDDNEALVDIVTQLRDKFLVKEEPKDAFSSVKEAPKCQLDIHFDKFHHPEQGRIFDLTTLWPNTGFQEGIKEFKFIALDLTLKDMYRFFGRMRIVAVSSVAVGYEYKKDESSLEADARVQCVMKSIVQVYNRSTLKLPTVIEFDPTNSISIDSPEDGFFYDPEERIVTNMKIMERRIYGQILTNDQRKMLGKGDLKGNPMRNSFEEQRVQRNLLIEHFKDTDKDNDSLKLFNKFYRLLARGHIYILDANRRYTKNHGEDIDYQPTKYSDYLCVYFVPLELAPIEASEKLMRIRPETNFVRDYELYDPKRFIQKGADGAVFHASETYSDHLVQRNHGLFGTRFVVKSVHRTPDRLVDIDEIAVMDQLQDCFGSVPLLHWLAIVKIGGLYCFLDSHCPGPNPHVARIPAYNPHLKEMLLYTCQGYPLEFGESPLLALQELNNACVMVIFITTPEFDGAFGKYMQRKISSSGSVLHDTMESRPKASLNDRLSRALQVSSSLARLHERHVYHRDMHANNILYSINKDTKELVLFVCDFSRGEKDFDTKEEEELARLKDIQFLSGLLVIIFNDSITQPNGISLGICSVLKQKNLGQFVELLIRGIKNSTYQAQEMAELIKTAIQVLK